MLLEREPRAIAGDQLMKPGSILPLSSIIAERILVVAPHPDDEALGCGGLIRGLADLGRSFHVAFVTDGGASHRNSPSWPRYRLAAAREDEAAEALRRLGIGDAPRTFMRIPDAGMPKRETVGYKGGLLAAIDTVRTFRPDLALLPWRRDPHCDHRDSWSLFIEAFTLAEFQPDILEYAIWLDEIGSPDDHPRPGEMERICFDISGVLKEKRVAVDAHVTQTTGLIDDDPDAFRLTSETIDRLVTATECYWRPVSTFNPSQTTALNPSFRLNA